MIAEITATDASHFGHVETQGLAFTVGFFFSFRLCIVLFSVRLFGVEPSTGTAVSIGLNLFLFALVCFYAVGAGKRTFRSIWRLSAIRWTLVFLVFSAFSLLWSETASLPNSLVYWIGMAVDVANVILLIRCGSGMDESISMLKGFIWSACCLALVAWIMPTAPDLRLGDEQFFNTNEIGNICAFAIFFAQFLTRCRHGEWRFAKFFLVITLVRSLSKTTLIAFLIGESLLLVLDRSFSRKAKIVLVTSAFSLILVFWGLFEAYYDVYTTTGNQAETLTGRIAIWLYVMAAALDHAWTPWIGHGFNSWWKVVPPFGGDMFEARHAENELLQQFYAYGAVGVVLLAGIYGSLFRQLRKLQQDPSTPLFLCFLIFIVVRGLAESDAFDLLLPQWTIVLISVLAASEGNRSQELPADSPVAQSDPFSPS